VIAEDFTFANVERVAQAAADYWRANPVSGTAPTIVVGFDGRFLSDAFGKRTAEVLAGNGLRVLLTPEPTPTPSVSFAVKARHTVGGVVITASHNPAIFNGFKLKSHFGGSAEPATCQAVERLVDRHPVKRTELGTALDQGTVQMLDVRPAHYTALKKLVDFKLIAKSRLRFAHDALFGVGAGCFDQILAGTTCRVTTLNGEHDPRFNGINPEPIEKN
jgi:phosphomannomutase